MLFIWTVNMLGFIPLPFTGETWHGIGPTWGIYAATSSISVTLALALMTFVFTHFEGIRWNGPERYFKSWIPESPKRDAAADRAARDPRAVHAPDLALSVRLFANMLAGHMLILTFIGLIFILENVFLAVVRSCPSRRSSTSSRSSSSSRSRRSSSPHCQPSTSARRSSPSTKEETCCAALILLATTGDVVEAGKAIALALGIGLGSLGAGVGIGNIFGSMIQSVARQPELRGELQGIMWLGLRTHRGGRLLRPARRDPRVRPRLMLDALARSRSRVRRNRLIKSIPGLMIWTLVCFLITFFVLRKYAFGPIQKMIDERRERIRQAIDEADNAREEARKLLEEHRELIAAGARRGRGDPRRGAPRRRVAARARPRGDRGRPPAPARGDASARSRPRRSARSEQIRAEVADLALVAAERVTGKVLDSARPASADRRGDRGARLLRSWRTSRTRWPSPTAPTRARSSRPPRSRPPRAGPRGARRLRRGRRETCRSSRAAREPQLDPRAKAAALGELARGRRASSSATSCSCSSRRAARRELRGDPARVRGLVAAEEERLAVELTTAYELSDDEAEQILAQIEQASGRHVEATRSVDPDLIGGFVLQRRLDARRRERARPPRTPSTRLVNRRS